MKKKHLFIALLFLGIAFPSQGQLTIEQCYERARQNYPQIKLYDLIAQSRDYSLQNASRGYLPQFAVTAKATYQSEVTKIPVTLPGIEIPTLHKDQYQAVAEVSQVIWDGGLIRSQKRRIDADQEMEQSRYEVDMYALRDRINELFFGLLAVEEQQALTAIYELELRSNYGKVEASMHNGIANQADLDVVSVELLNLSQRRAELEATHRAFSAMLAYFICEAEGNRLQLVKPDISPLTDYFELPAADNKLWMNRPEMQYYASNIKLLEAQKESLTAQNRPRISAFIQGGYGNPGLNMLEEGFHGFALGGIRLNWNFSGLYTRKNDLQKINNQIDRVNMQQDIFHFNTRMQTLRQQNEVNKYLKILKEDGEIIRLRENIKKASMAKVENGTLSVNDLIRDIHAEQTARRNKALHEIEMIRSIYQLKHTLNNE